MKEWLTIAMFVGGFGVVAYFSYLAMGGPTNLGCSENRSYEAMKAKVSEGLVSPTSAVFPEWETVAKKSETDCSFDVDGYLDSQNAMGVMIRSKYIGKTFKTHDGYAAVATIMPRK